MNLESAHDIIQRQIDYYQNEADEYAHLIERTEKEIVYKQNLIHAWQKKSTDCGFMIGLLEREMKK